MQLPLFEPKSLWRPPSHLPELDSVIAIDVETRDPNIKTLGPGWKRGSDGEVVGIALADANHTLYLPFAHKMGDNLPKNTVISYVKRMVQQATEVIMANAQYDLGWLETLGITVPCVVRDVQVAEALIDEERYSYSLNALSNDYLKRPKDESHLKLVAEEFGICPKAGLWQLAARHVGRYAEMDARNTYDIYPLQLPRLQADDLIRVWELECETTKVLLSMSRKGVPVDLQSAEKLRDQLVRREKALEQQFSGVDIWSPPQLAKFCIKQGITPPKTDKGNYSVNKQFLEQSEHPILKQILEARGINRLRKVFIEDIVLNGNYRGRIHACFKQVTSDDGGTRSGRLSSSNPNMQQVPKRSEWGKKIRGIYVAEPDTQWCKADYSSQEPRLQVHYALLSNMGHGLPKAQEARDAFAAGVKLYTFFEDATGLPYDTCKMLCLGISYGMGKDKMAETLGVSVDECSSILEQFNSKAPFLRMLFDNAMAAANKRGFIRTILGRRSRFDQWSSGYGSSPITGYSKAQSVYEGQRIQRAFTSKALNRLIQGSAADQTKIAMVELHKQGIDLRLPVHDELNAMVTSDKEVKLITDIMEHAIELKVPTVADVDLGPTWC